MESKKEIDKSLAPKSAAKRVETSEIQELMKSLGTESRMVGEHLLAQIARVSPLSYDDQGLAGLLGMEMLKSFRPKDDLEALLCAQMISVHNFAMRLLGSANHSDQTDSATFAKIENANKLLRTFATQLEALNRHRGKGQQKVTVEHVTVNKGGQAVIGAIERPLRGDHEEK